MGHTAAKCTAILPQFQVPPNLNINKRVLSSETINSTAPEETKPEDTPMTSNMARNMETASIKKNSNTKHSDNHSNHKNKKPKVTQDQPTLDELLQPVREVLTTKPHNYNFNYEELLSFINDIKNAPHPLEVTKKFTNDIETFISSLKDLRGVLNHRKIKYRFTRIIHNIEKQLGQKNDDETASITSESYQSNDSDSLYF